MRRRRGKAKITPAYNLPSKFVLHTVGPIILGELEEEDCRLLADCYRSCLALARPRTDFAPWPSAASPPASSASPRNGRLKIAVKTGESIF